MPLHLLKFAPSASYSPTGSGSLHRCPRQRRKMDIEDGRVSSIPLIGPGFAKEQTLWRCVVLGERLLAAVLLVALSPLLLGLALLTLILSGRSPLIAHRRVGWKGTELWLLKFRTMWRCGGKAG